jgi:hypothetical protein
MTIYADALAAMLDGLDTFAGTGSGTANITLYQTNTALCVFPLSNTPFGAAVAGSLVLAGTPISSTGTEVAGKANRFVLHNRDGDEALSGSIGGIGSGADIETPALAITAAATQILNSFVVRLDSTGELSVEASLTLV